MTHPAPNITLEVCVDSLGSAKTAAGLGAQRIELNAGLELGGLTPSIGLVEQVVGALRPMGCGVITMVRPRPGGFAYHADELSVMRHDIHRLLGTGVDGVALGVLDPQGSIDEHANRELIRPVLDAGKEAVFHRAFDLTPDPIDAMQGLVTLGFSRVLTSGQAPSAIQGAATIRRLIRRAQGSIGVLPGGGITPGNVAKLVRETGCHQVHASLRRDVDDATGSRNPAIRFDSPPPANRAFTQADPDQIEAMMAALQHLQG